MGKHLIRPIPLEDLVEPQSKGISTKLSPEAFSLSLKNHYTLWVSRAILRHPAYIGYETREMYDELIQAVQAMSNQYASVIYNLTYFSQIKDTIWKLELREVNPDLIVYFAIAYIAETKVFKDRTLTSTPNFLLKYTLRDTVNLDMVYRSRILDFYFGLGLVYIVSPHSIDENAARYIKQVIDRIVSNTNLYRVYLEEQSSKIKE